MAQAIKNEENMHAEVNNCNAHLFSGGNNTPFYFLHYGLVMLHKSSF